ncbi:S1 family peptidase [Sphaerimonospora thailandensis]|uniref:S1 family peptidase n=1 Tax=Sphaerimonospora thailandensis TaxID=795644 RepID=UPI001950E10D|nr:serine protease [Sphaerimonospora thailandensis]
MNGRFRKYRIRGTLTAAAVALAALAASPASPASAEPGDDVSVGTRLAARTHPAVQLTSLTYSGQVVVPTGTIKEGPFNELVQQATAAVLDGKISSDERSIAKYLFQRMAADVDRYLKPTGPERKVKAEVGGLCTGWWVTPDGYMVTGAHCVQMSDRELTEVFAQQALAKLNKQDAKEIIKGLRGIEADAELIQLAQQVYVNFNSGHLQIRGLNKSLSVVQSLPGGGVDKTAKPVPAELVSVGENYPGKDFALLKVNGQQNLPTVPLGDDSDVQTGSTLYISGFPGLVTNTPFFSLESKLEPALTEGPYNAKRTTQEGVPYIQTQAPSYHGNSGGPVFSKDGKVIGMLIAGTVSEGGEASESESFVLPVSIIMEKLNEKNIKPAQSLTTTKYDEALNDFFLRHYKNALPKFREVQALHPNHPYVAKYITDSQQAISSGKDETPQPLWVWIAIGAGGLVVVAGVVVAVLMLRRRKAGPQAAAVQTPSQATAQGWQQTNQAWQQTNAPAQDWQQGNQAWQQQNAQGSQQQPQQPQHVEPGFQPNYPQPGNPQASPAMPQPGYPQPLNPQPLNSQAGYPQPVNPQPVNPQPVNPQAGAQPPSVAALEQEIAELRRRLEQRPPGA